MGARQPSAGNATVPSRMKNIRYGGPTFSFALVPLVKRTGRRTGREF